ncbi:hypothetical protein JCM11491_002581 [Sporobolomyces phaffii]
MILIPAALHSLLSQLTTREAAPHTAILTASPLAGGSILSYAAVAPNDIARPFPRPALVRAGDDEGHDEEETRVGCYAALAVGTWNEQRTQQGQRSVDPASEGPLTLETEVGRIAVMDVAGGSFLLILVGSEVTPWKVLDKKIRAAEEYLTEPLSKLST